jgi:DNA-binding PadR family transcriptional regulator
MLRNQEYYGYDINRRLADQGMGGNISRLYGILNDMQKDGLLWDRWERSSEGPRKKMYSLTESGKQALNEILLNAISIVHLFYGDYLRGLYPRVDVFGEILGVLTDGMRDGERLAYLSYGFTGIDLMLVRSIHEKNPLGKLYLIKPSSLELNLELENTNIFDGDYNDLPFKDDFFDRLIVIGVPPQETLQESAKEWRRVIDGEGKLVIITPSVLVQNLDEPMSIGDFVEKYEHQVIEQGSQHDPDQFFSTLRNQFSNVVDREATHMKFITAQD